MTTLGYTYLCSICGIVTAIVAIVMTLALCKAASMADEDMGYE
jgi:flagellin-like protein